jgi:predicted lipoprotein with Yx(FWY)xxD motif
MHRILMLFGVSVLLFAACGGDDATGTSGSDSASQDEPTGQTISLANTVFGDALVDQDGRSLYMFVPDQQKSGTPTCYDDCAQAWPALEGQVSAGEGVDESLLGTVERKDGTQQVTYNDLPLYHFSGDQAEGDVNGQALGGVWWIMNASGSPIKEKPTRVSLGTTEFGDVLVDEEGMTLYMFVPDQQENGTPTCYGECEKTWPPLKASESGVFLPGEGIDESLLGSADRKDGTQQVTYNDLPLYRFSGDQAEGDVNGQGLGDVWWVMDASGKPIQKKAGN